MNTKDNTAPEAKHTAIFSIQHVDYMPEQMDDGVIYIADEYDISIHLCACGCKQKTVMPLGPKGWDIRINGDNVSFTPSIGNFSWENRYHAHYYITDNKVVWCEPPTTPTNPHKPDDFAPYELEP